MVYRTRPKRPPRTPESPGEIAARHERAHVARGRFNRKCQLCRESGRSRRVVLQEKEVAALEQLVARVEGVAGFIRDLIGAPHE